MNYVDKLKGSIQRKLDRKAQNKSMALERSTKRQAKVDRRLTCERGYDACVVVGMASANSGTCISAIVAGMAGE